jgi:hypothetical protein
MKQIDLITIVLLFLLIIGGISYYLISSIIKKNKKEDPTPTPTTPAPTQEEELNCGGDGIGAIPPPPPGVPYCVLNLDVQTMKTIGGQSNFESWQEHGNQQPVCAYRPSSKSGATQLSLDFYIEGKAPSITSIMTVPLSAQEKKCRLLQHPKTTTSDVPNADGKCPDLQEVFTSLPIKKSEINFKNNVPSRLLANSTCRIPNSGYGGNFRSAPSGCDDKTPWKCMDYAPFCVDASTIGNMLDQGGHSSKFITFQEKQAFLYKTPLVNAGYDDPANNWVWVCMNNTKPLYPFTHAYTSTIVKGVPLEAPTTLGMTIETGYNPVQKVE